jgi:hypothetical protein
VLATGDTLIKAKGALSHGEFGQMCSQDLFGIAMGGEWGVGASLTMESIPQHARGFVSGLLQSGYPAPRPFGQGQGHHGLR